MIVTRKKEWNQKPNIIGDFNNLAEIKNRPYKDGQYYIADNGAVYRYFTDTEDVLELAPKGVPVTKESQRAQSGDELAKLVRLKRLIQMRDTVRDILDLQERISDEEIGAAGLEEPPWAEKQRELHKLYDAFYSTYGAINHYEWQRAGVADSKGEQPVFKKHPNLRTFRRDPDAYLVASLEIFNEDTGEARKAPVFYERILAPRYHLPRVETVSEALNVCLSEKAKVDPAFMTELLPDMEPEQIMAALSRDGKVFYDPGAKRWETREAYLSGNVRAKHSKALNMAKRNPYYEAHVKALESVMPEEVGPADINVHLGAHWIPPEIVKQFAEEELGLENVTVHYIPKAHRWFAYGDVYDHYKAGFEFGTEHLNSLDLLSSSLNGRKAKVHGRKIKNEALNKSETELACGAQDSLENRFKEWIWEDEKRAGSLIKYYNDTFNSLVPQRPDGSHMRLPGTSLAIQLRDNQKNVAWRNVTSGNTLYAHEVGAGKTFASITAAMELKRLGKAEKPCFVVPNHMLVQFSRDFMQLYPNGNILVLEQDQFQDDGKPTTSADKIEKFVRRARDHDWDAIFITQSNFDQLNVSPQTELQLRLDDIRDYRDMLQDEAFAGKGETQSYLRDLYRKKVEELKEFLCPVEKTPDFDDEEKEEEYYSRRDKIEELFDNSADHDSWLSYLKNLDSYEKPGFEDTGIDYLFVDEGQDYKNLGISSRYTGLSRSGSARAENMDRKLCYLRQQNPENYISLMTATPVSNTVSEIYTMTRYLAPELLDAYGIESFDAWVSMFAEPVNAIEMVPEGGDYRMMERIAKYKNVPELLRMFHSFADIVLRDELNLDIPELKGGKHQIVTVPRSESLAGFFDELAERSVRIRNGQVSSDVDNMLKVTMEGRLATTHPALVGLGTSLETPAKVEALAEEVAKRYHTNKDNVYYDDNGEPEDITGALQMVFSDIGIPKTEDDFSVYAEIKKQLVEKGVPAETIRFVHDYDTDKKKGALFEDCRQGRVSVLLGTTQKLGTGTNVQKRLIAQHHLDVPWRPSDLIQRDGRILRQKNQNKEVEILRYVMENSFDAYMWQTLERKLKFISQIMRGHMEGREIEELEPLIMTYTEAKMAAANDPDMIEYVEVETALEALQKAKNNHDRSRRRAVYEVQERELELEKLEERLKGEQSVRRSVKPDPDIAVPVTLGEETFDSIAGAENALKAYLRSLRKELRGNDSGCLSRKNIGTVHGKTMSLDARVDVDEKEREDEKSGEKRIDRQYKYEFKLTVNDPVKTSFTLSGTDIRETKQERELRLARQEAEGKGMDLSDTFDDISQNEEEENIETRQIITEILGRYENLGTKIDHLKEELGRLKSEFEGFSGAASEEFPQQKEYDELSKRMKVLNEKLMRKKRNSEENKPQNPAPAGPKP